jgi:hypothetical protein
MPVTPTTNHVTALDLGLCNDGAVYTVNIIGDGIPRTPRPNGGCTELSGSIVTISIGFNERITRIEAFRNSIN